MEETSVSELHFDSLSGGAPENSDLVFCLSFNKTFIIFNQTATFQFIKKKKQYINRHAST